MKMILNKLAILLLLASAFILLYRFGDVLLADRLESNFSLNIKVKGTEPDANTNWYFLACDQNGRLSPALLSKKQKRSEHISIFRFSNGEAHVKGYIDRPGLYVLTNQDRTCHLPFLIDTIDQQITVVSDSLFQTKDLLTLIPFAYTGSEINREFIDFWKKEEAQLLLKADAEYLQWLQNSKTDADQLSEEQKQVFAEQREEHLTQLNHLKESVALSYLEENPNSYLALDYFLSYVFTPKFTRLEEADMEYYISLLGNKLQQTEVYKSISSKYKTCQNFCINKTPPPFELPDSRGELVNLKDFTGNVTLVNFWVIDCDYCKAEHKNLLDLYAKYHEKEFEIVSIAFDKNKERWQTYIDEQGMPWQQVLDTIEAEHSNIIRDYGGLAMPTSFLLDKEGKVVAKNLRCPAYAKKAKYNMNTQLEKIFGF